MATSIAFHFEDLKTSVSSGWPDSVMERWTQNARAGGVDNIIMIDQTTYKIGQYYKHPVIDPVFTYHQSLQELEDANPTATFVYFEQKSFLDSLGITSTILTDFVHPDPSTNDVIYVVGPDSKSVPTTGRESATWVSIPAVVDQMYWAEQVAGVVIWDRYNKSL